MLITLLVANSFKIANHTTDLDAIYIDSLKLVNPVLKKGIGNDRISFSLPIETLEHISELALALCYDTIIDVLLDGTLILSSYVTKLTSSDKNIITFELNSIATWQLNQFVSPSIQTTCQNQAYSKNCNLDLVDNKCSFSNLTIDGLTGSTSLISGSTLILGGVEGVTTNEAFFNYRNLMNAHVIINGKYKSRIVLSSKGSISFALNYLDRDITFETVDLYLACDKTYGQCYSRFNNVSNFWGFANSGRTVQTFDIFSSDKLEYCGDDLVDQDLVICDNDKHIFGVEI